MTPIHPLMPLIVHHQKLPICFGLDYQRLADRSSIVLTIEPALP